MLRIDGNAEKLEPFDVAVGPAGLLALRQIQEPRLIVFDSAGRRVSVVGRAGVGPGEFLSVSGFGWVSDTLWVYSRNQRLSRFLHRGEFVNVRPLPEPYYSPGSPHAGVQLALTRVTVVYGGGGMLARTAPIANVPVRCACFVVVSDSMEIERVIATSPSRLMPRSSVGSGNAAASAPFSWGYDMVPSTSGDRVGIIYATAEDSRSGRWRITVIDRNGDTTINRSLATALDRIPDTEVAKSLNKLGPDIAAAGSSTVELRSLVPRYYQPYSTMILGRDSTVWIKLRSPPDSSRWLVTNGQGEIIGRLSLPATIIPKQVQRDRIWAAQEDADGVQHLVIFSVRQ